MPLRQPPTAPLNARLRLYGARRNAERPRAAIDNTFLSASAVSARRKAVCLMPHTYAHIFIARSRRIPLIGHRKRAAYDAAGAYCRDAFLSHKTLAGAAYEGRRLPRRRAANISHEAKVFKLDEPEMPFRRRDFESQILHTPIIATSSSKDYHARKEALIYAS